MDVLYEERLERLRRKLRAQRVGCAVLMPGPNLFYFTGLRMEPSERITLGFFPANSTKGPALLLPELERPRVEAELEAGRAAPLKLYSYRDEEGPDEPLVQIVQDLQLGGRTLGVEFRGLRLLEASRLERHVPGGRIESLDSLLYELRSVKDPTEIERLRKALVLTEELFAELLAFFKPGRTEQELAKRFQILALERGFEISFEPIIASGPNGGSPHAVPTERALQPGDLVTVDVGVMWEDYYGDLTRNVALGKIDPELQKIHAIVEEANAAGREACKPGVPAQEVDRAARRVIEKAGYGPYFFHRTGHGLGLEVHEPPYMMEGSERLLEPGMVFTVEPGIYLPGQGGARVEDVMLITETGAETLTTLPRNPFSMATE